MGTSVTLRRGVKYAQILQDEDFLIDIHMLVRLFRSVAPKLESILREANDNYIVAREQVKRELTTVDKESKSEVLFIGIDIIYNNRFHGFTKNVESFKEVSDKLATRIVNHIQCNEKELLHLIMESNSLVPSIFELLADVDLLEDEIVSMFKEMTDFLNEISSHFRGLYFLGYQSEALNTKYDIYKELK